MEGLTGQEEIVAESETWFAAEQTLCVFIDLMIHQLSTILDFVIFSLRCRKARAGKWEIPGKKYRPAASSSTIINCKNPCATPPGIEPGSCKASSLSTTPPRGWVLGTVYVKGRGREKGERSVPITTAGAPAPFAITVWAQSWITSQLATERGWLIVHRWILSWRMYLKERETEIMVLPMSDHVDFCVFSVLFSSLLFHKCNAVVVLTSQHVCNGSLFATDRVIRPDSPGSTLVVDYFCVCAPRRVYSRGAYRIGTPPLTQRLERSPHTTRSQVRFLAVPLLNFHTRESLRTMPLVGGFSRGSPVSPALAFRRCSVLTSLHPRRLSRTSMLRAVQNIFFRSDTVPCGRVRDSYPGGSGGAVDRALTSHHGDPSSIPGGFTPGSSHVGIVLDDVACRRVFSGHSRFPRPSHPAPLHPRA
ncbi:hypothetical protein PR048_014349 [Dryococelus australis]|uniref:Uncharacterized protein n=1 Tax=Dryococelus australis TaxID=614101 RepID=A0ABQ9HE06_9NEOP|nr:hypothetical protein PR048_014349 [Dryococelus australis]